MSKSRPQVGTVIHGFARGAFGRDSFECRKVEAVGADWIVTRNAAGAVEMTTDSDFDPDDRSYCNYSCPFVSVASHEDCNWRRVAEVSEREAARLRILLEERA